MVICLERGADLLTAQLMPLPLTVSCSSNIHTGLTFLVPAHPGSPGQGAVERVCVLTYLIKILTLSHCSLNFEWPRLGYGFLSIMVVVEKCNLGP